MKKLVMTVATGALLFSNLMLKAETEQSLFATGASTTSSPVSSLRIGESNPNIYVVRIPGGEQLIGQAFQQDALVSYNGYQYTVYYNENRNVCIARRILPLGQWQEVVLPHRNTANDAHNTISMGICAVDGTIHISYDHHNDALRYCRSIIGLANDPENMKWETASFGTTTSQMVEGVIVPDVTYPRFVQKPDGNLLFECRFGLSGDGDSYIREYDGNTHKWSMVGRYIQGMDGTPDACAYINRIEYDNVGKLHVTWCWRDDFGGGSNHDLYYGYSEDHGRTWKDNDGNLVATTELMEPVWDRTSGTCMNMSKTSLMVEQIPHFIGYINTETQFVDSKGRVHVVSSHMYEGTDHNWASSRSKAVLHHRYRDIDGTWKKRMVKKNGAYVHSYCRVQLAMDAFDNAYIVANGAEIYVATPQNDYDDWQLLSDVDKGRFISEPQVDRNLLLSQGVLSYVYLADNQRMVVVDYLLDNPNTPTGTGLLTEYFSDTKFEDLISTKEKTTVSGAEIPEGTKAIRWSGSFETLYGEEYTLFLNTAAKTVVYIDNQLVFLSDATSTAQEYTIKFDPVASHKHNLVIEMESAGAASASLKWSSKRTSKTTIPLTVCYPEKANAAGTVIEPALKGKLELEEKLMGKDNIKVTDKGTSVFTLPFDIKGDYSLEVKAKINAAEGRGLDIDARTPSGKGFRVSIGEKQIDWTAPLKTPEKLLLSDNREEFALRFAIQNNNIHIYKDTVYISTQRLADIGEISNDVETAVEKTVGPEIIGDWAGPDGNNSGKPTDYKWEATPSGKINFVNANENAIGAVRYMDTTHSLATGGNYTGRLLTLRWDDGSWADVCYSYPVTLEAGSTYRFSMLFEVWGSASGSQQITVGAAKRTDGSGQVGSQTFATHSSNQVLKRDEFEFTTQEAGTYYITFKGAHAMFGIGDLSLKKISTPSRLIIGKNYQAGKVDIDILSITYEQGAFAPRTPQPEFTPDLEVKEILSDELVKSKAINSATGSKDIYQVDVDPKKNYSLEVSAIVTSAVGRGLDIEIRDTKAMGFRTSMDTERLNLTSPFSEPLLISAVEKEKQIIRYAVTAGELVHIYRNGKYVDSYELVEVGDMNAEGTAEKSLDNNLIENGDFRKSMNNAAPIGWLSDNGMGGGVAPRVQVANAEIPGDDPLRAAFVIRFDNNGGTWYSYPVDLKPDTNYDFSFDLIAWGTNTDKTVGVVISTSQDGTSGVLVQETVSTPSVRATSDKIELSFKTPASSNATERYFISFVKKEEFSNTGITNLELYSDEEPEPLNRLLYGKNYTSGAAQITIDYITYDPSGAYAPYVKTPPVVNIEEGVISSIPFTCFAKDNMLYIENLTGKSHISIYDVTGRNYLHKMFNQEFISVPLPNGIYIVKIQTENSSSSRKVVVK